MTYRGEVNEFHYASTGTTSGEYFVSALGTAASGIRKTVHITDIKATCGTTARTIAILGKGSGTLPQSLEFDLPASSVTNFSWEIPYKMTLVSTTGAVSGFVASASGGGVKYSISGFTD